jgi:GH15 family glucan-1,4-alpha-glucosidase
VYFKMPRDLPIGNGSLLLNFDKQYNLRDIYWPYVGQELHTSGDISHTGVWVNNQFAWLDDPAWQREVLYEEETLVTHVTLHHPALQLQLVFQDVVDFDRPLFIRHVVVKNEATEPREVRLFFHYDWYLWNDVAGNTVFYYPEQKSLVAYKLEGYFLVGGMTLQGTEPVYGISSWATGVKKFNGAQGTWLDAEDGVLGKNPIAQGSVDSTIALHLPAVPAEGSSEAYHWLAVGRTLPEVAQLNELVQKRTPQAFLDRTYHYWHRWVNKDDEDYLPLSPELVQLYKRSLLVLRTQIDQGGAVIAANDADVQHFSEDSYSYMWPRDGALVANALSHAGYSEITRNFYDFCNSVQNESGYLLHKYNPDRSWGSSWHPWIDADGEPQLPIQEDETALVIYSLWQHYTIFHDLEFVAPHYHTMVTPAANFLVDFRDEQTKLPRASYDLWEERHGILSFTVAAVYAGLTAAQNFAELFGEELLATKYRTAAEEIKAATLHYLWDEDAGHFLRMINVLKDGSIQRDMTLDSSICGLFLFSMFPANDPHIERTMQLLEQRLWAHTSVGGMARYENDYYYQTTHDLTQAQGNPWFICTLWLAQYRIAHSTTLTELSSALPLLDWVRTHALPSGVMAEQVNPFTSDPLSVSPLTWSHAEFVLTIRWYLGKYRHLTATH